jgi:hypothetical protein
MEENKQVVPLTIQLQLQLEKLTDEEFAEYMKDKVLSYDGKLYTLEENKCPVN